MSANAPKLSIVAQSLDRAAFVAYFLGAIVPLAALGALVHVWVLPHLDDRLSSAGVVAGMLSIGLLSGGAFLLLRQVTRRALAAMRTDNERLETLLEGATRLTAHEHAREVAVATTAAAQRVARAAGAFFVSRAAGDPPKLEAASGDASLAEVAQARAGELFERALADGRPLAWRHPSGGGALLPVAGAGALVVVLPPHADLDTHALRALGMLAAQASIAMRRVELIDAQRNFFVHVTDILVAALDSHMDLQAGHARRVAQLANRLGRELGLDEARRQRLHFAALLHDVGMLRIDPARLEDKRVARQHPQLGHRMLAPIRLWAEVAPLVLHHHEWFDGSGYPEQLAGEAIPLESRIIGVAEAFDSMTSRATYKAPVASDEAVRRIEAGSGTQFDPDVVRAFLDLARRGDLDLG